MNDNSGAPFKTNAAGWLRQNLAIAIALTSLVSATGGAVINGTSRLASYDGRLAALEAGTSPRIDRMAQVEIKLNAIDERRIADVAAYGTISQRLGVLKSQVRFLGEFAHDSMTAQMQGKKR